MSDICIVNNDHEVDNSPSIDALVINWIEKLKNAQEGHYKETESLNIIHQRVGILLIFLTTLVTAFIFYDPDLYPELIKFLIGVASAIAAALSGVVSFGRFGERANEHRITASRYGKLRRQLEYLRGTSFDATDTEDFKKKLKMLRVEWEYVALNAPLTPKKKSN